MSADIRAPARDALATIELMALVAIQLAGNLTAAAARHRSRDVS